MRGTPEPTVGCGGLSVCEDFEMRPAGVVVAGGGWSVTAPNCNGIGVLEVDTTVFHSGQKSLKVQGAAGYWNHIFLAPDIGKLGRTFFGRAYVRFEKPLGEDHVSFASFRDDAQNNDLRIGEQKSILMWNRESDDATLPELSPTRVAASVAPSAGAWHCLEVSIEGEQGRLKTWIDGAAVVGLEVDGTPTPDVDAQWLRQAAWAPGRHDCRNQDSAGKATEEQPTRFGGTT